MSGGGITILQKTVTVNFNQPGYEGVFTVNDADVSANTNLVLQSFVPVGDVDELEFDQVSATCLPAAGLFTVYAQAQPGPIYGDYTLKYQVIK